jgi:hypothetical protein
MPRTIGKVAMTLLLLAGLLAPTAGAGQAAAQPVAASQQQFSREPYFFEETGHYLSGRFRQYWEANGGLYVFGFPLTKVYPEVSTDGNTYLTQYFERARFEYHPENQAPFDVLLTLMGNEIAAGRRNEDPFLPGAPVEGTTDTCPGYFEATGHNVQGIFCEFWQRYGGLQNFGFAISEEFPEANSIDGVVYTVQYFERGRWEYHPELAGTPFEVLLGQLGLERMNRVGVDFAVRARETSPPTAAEIPGGVPGGAPVAAVCQTQLPPPHIEYGFNTFLIGNEGGATYNNQTLDKVREAGFGWARIQAQWRELEPFPGQYNWAPLDIQVNAAQAKGLKLMVSTVQSPSWASPSKGADYHGLPEDTNAFYNLMRLMADRYAGRVQAYEIWNEQNLAGEVGGNVQVAPYFETLRNGYLGVKRNDPCAVVLFGGLTPTGVTDPGIAIDDVRYLQEFFAFRGGEGRQYYDALAAHPGSASNPPDARFGNAPGDCPPAAIERYGPQPSGCYNGSPDFFFRRIEEQRAVMEQNGEAGKQIWLTEFGWDSCTNLPAPRGYEYCQLTTEAEQAQFLVRAFEIGRTEWPWMGVMIMWNLNYQTVPGIGADDEKYAWGVLRPDFTSRPAYEALKNMPK